jgi:hypothetical protein
VLPVLIDGKDILLMHVVNRLRTVYVENNKGQYYSAVSVFADNNSGPCYSEENSVALKPSLLFIQHQEKIS